MFKRVLTATGTPDACEPALITALEIAKQNQGRLFILHVMEATYRHECGPQESVKDFKTGEAVAPTHEYKEAVKAELDKKCAGALRPYGNYEMNVVEGRPGIEIRRWASKVGADLVVLGPHTERVEEERTYRRPPWQHGGRCDYLYDFAGHDCEQCFSERKAGFQKDTCLY